MSNADFLKFVKDNGYQQEKFWSEEGWKWADGTKSLFPRFWVKRAEGLYTLRLQISETENMPWNMPAEVNCFEGNAYCRWLSSKSGSEIRLPTEDEYYSMLKHIEFDSTKAKVNIGLT